LVTIGIDSGGQIFAKSQVTDYLLRGEDLSQFNLLRFFVDTYDIDFDKREKAAANIQVDDDSKRKPGRPRNPRVHYLQDHPKYRQKCRVIRSKNH
jgi:hypothetical protein